MALSPNRARACLCGTLTGAFAAVPLVAARRDRPTTAVTALLSVICSSAAVACEERAKATEDGHGRDAT